MRGLAVFATGALLWGFAAAPASADNIRDGQWALQNYGAADRVWPVSQGEGVIVAVIDSGVMEHQDLTGQVLPGADFPSGGSGGRADSVGHGTAMASEIAGHAHDGNAGIMGLAPKTKILPVKIALDGDGQLASDTQDGTIASAIRFAVDHGAKVINMSFSARGYVGHTQEREAVRYALDKDVVLVAAAGNNGHEVEYPAALPGVVAAGAVDQQGNVWAKSNFGPQVTLAAPGVEIYHADSKSPTSYAKGSGTSDSAAYVSAIAALVRSKYPDLSAGQVINRMIKSAVPPPDQSAVPNDKYGYGIASPAGALKPNPAVDSGPKDNPLLGRPESKAGSDEPSSGSTAPAATGGSGDSKSASGESGAGSNVVLFAIGGGVLAVLVVVLVVVLVRRSRGGGGSGGSGGPGGGPGAPGGYGYPGPGQQVQQPYPPQGYQSQPYAQQQPPYPPQQGYPPQPPAGGNPYQGS